MTTNNDGGPAFPSSLSAPSGQYGPAYVGMTLRDWFAGQALVGLVLLTQSTTVTEELSVDLGRLSYALADAMLDEREEST